MGFRVTVFGFPIQTLPYPVLMKEISCILGSSAVSGHRVMHASSVHNNLPAIKLNYGSESLEHQNPKPAELQSELLNGGYIGDYIGDYHGDYYRGC